MSSTLRSANVFTDPALPLSVSRVLVDWNVADHAHEFQELVYVEKGRSQHEVALAAPRSRASRYDLLPGDCFIIAPQEHHAFHKPRGLVVWNILFLPELFASERARLDAIPGLAEFLFIEPLFRHEGGAMPKLHLGVEARARALGCLQAVAGECARKADGYATAARAHFLVFLVELARAWSARAKPAASPAAAGQRHAIDAAIAFMEERYGEDLSLKDIAAQAYLSPHHFSETFKRACGMPPFEFLLRLRLDRAQELLRSSQRSVTDIALSVGFGDSSYFARVFKTQLGMTPRAWRGAQGAAPE